MTKRNLLNIALVFALVSAILLSMVGFSDSCNEMYENVIRIRIIANSDSQDDQNLKIKIRDAVLEESKRLFDKTDNYDEAVTVTEGNLDSLLKVAKETVLASGYSYDVDVEFREEFFDTRVYEDFTLPAGSYKTAVFTVGEGTGKNWWCVIFPQVCVGACSGRLNDAISDEAADYAYNSNEYIVKFKTVEIFEKIKNYFNLKK